MAHIAFTDMSGQECTVPLSAQAPVVSIGRAVDCTIRSNRKSVSRHHAEFRFTNGQFEIIDLNSSNGTYLIINEQRRPVMGREYVTHNDEVWCGDFILRFLDDEPADIYVEDRTVEGDDHIARAPIATFDKIPPNPGFPPSNFNEPAPPQNFNEPPQQSGWANQPSPGSEPSWVEPGEPAQPAWANAPSSPAPNPDPIQPSWATDAPPSPERSWGEESPDDGPQWAPQDDGWTKPKSTHDAVGTEQIERLRAEKQSIEDMASRQRQEIERLEALLEELRVAKEQQAHNVSASAESEAQVQQLTIELSESRLEKERLQAELEREREHLVRMDELEREIVELRSLNNTTRDELMEARELQADPELEQSLRDEIAAKTADVLELQSELSQQGNELTRLSEELEAAKLSAQEIDAAQEETSQLRDEVKRKERLVVEFERRNRELQHDLTVHEEASVNLKEEIDRLRDVVDSSVSNEAVQTELDESRRALDEARQTIQQLSKDLDAAKADTESVDRIETLETENDALREALAHQNAIEQTVVATESTPPEVREFLQNLERIVDAIDRADLDPLSTVDRVRLQSAIRETDPKNTLKSILESIE